MGRAVVVDCLPWLALLVASCLVLRLLARINSARFDWRRLLRLHGDEVGSAQSLSFVLTLPFFVMIMLFIAQVSQVMIATVVVHYAAYAAARSAVVWIPARVSEVERENCIADIFWEADEPGQSVPIVDPDSPDYGPSLGGTIWRIAPGGMKYRKIQSAAVMACIPISPSRDTNYRVPGDWRQIADLMNAAMSDAAPAPSSGQAAITRRLYNKLAYAAENTQIRVRMFHVNTEPPLMVYQVPPDIEEFRDGLEVGWQDTVTVDVWHHLALLPGPGRLLARRVAQPDGSEDRISREIEQRAGVYTYTLTASCTLGNEGEKSVVPYVEPLEQ
jgi:hypothetical protein